MTRWPVLLLLPALAAQTEPTDELQRLRRDLLEAQARTQRLIDLRVRHDLGLTAGFEAYVDLTDGDRQALAEPGLSLEKEQREIERLSAQEAMLEHQVATRRRENIEQALAIARQPVEPGAAPAAEPALEPERPPERPAPHEAARPAAAGPAPELLRGSRDHRAVGRALFAAGRHADARAELQLVIDGGSPELIDLFYFARCHERLGDAEEARRWFLEIEARDTTVGPKGPLPGTWARSARAARQIMEWIQDRGAWQPATAIESIGGQTSGRQPR
jgi:hypothetical protein